MLMWLTALADPGKLGLVAEMSSNGRLSAAASLKMFEYLVSLTPSAVSTWAADLTARQSELVPAYRKAALTRLARDLPQEGEGHPDLLEVAVLAP
jgi:hypothetical protein